MMAIALDQTIDWERSLSVLHTHSTSLSGPRTQSNDARLSSKLQSRIIFSGNLSVQCLQFLSTLAGVHPEIGKPMYDSMPSKVGSVGHGF